MTSDDPGWVPEACTLPTVERPVRLAEFDELFATALLGQQRVSPTVLRWRLDRSAEHAARDLAARESSCCSFFAFTFTSDDDNDADAAVRVEVRVPAAYVEVLDALADRVSTGDNRGRISS